MEPPDGQLKPRPLKIHTYTYTMKQNKQTHSGLKRENMIYSSLSMPAKPSPLVYMKKCNEMNSFLGISN